MSELLHKVDEANAPAEQVSSTPVLTPAVDIYENEKELVLTADLPGVKQEDLKIKLDKDVLTIEGLSHVVDNPASALLLTEFGAGHYFRQFTLGQSINRDGIVAKLTSGQLILTLPKAAAAQPQQIAISAD
jgi:HSP20 family protein